MKDWRHGANDVGIFRLCFTNFAFHLEQKRNPVG